MALLAGCPPGGPTSSQGPTYPLGSAPTVVPDRAVARPPRPRGRVRPRASHPVVLVRVRETFVRRAPSNRVKHLGVVRRGSRMRTRGLVPGPGCAAGWYRLAPGGYLCADAVAVTRAAPGGPHHPVLRAGRLLPYHYVAVRIEGSGEYLQPEDAASDYFARELAPRNAITVSGRTRYDGEWFWRTTRRTYVPASEVYSIRASPFAGQRITGAWKLPLVFVHRRRAPHYQRPGRRRRTWAKRFERFVVLERRRRGGRTWYRVGAATWLRDHDVRLVEQTPPPPGLGPRSRWIDIDVARQILVAYEGRQPRFATLVSTGKRGQTPRGTFRIWAKLAATDMRSRPRESYHYQLWDVPWTVFFKGAYAIHGTYWHNRFGHRKSAGCVNLSPRDARWVFDFVSPALPVGWWAILPKAAEKPSLVRVRDSRRRPGRRGLRRRLRPRRR